MGEIGTIGVSTTLELGFSSFGLFLSLDVPTDIPATNANAKQAAVIGFQCFFILLSKRCLLEGAGKS